MSYQREMIATWSDMDFNSHMRNTAYIDKSADVRMMFFDDNGFSMDKFYRLNFGPIVRSDKAVYFKEIRLQEPITIALLLGGISEDGSNFHFVNEIYNGDGKLSVRVSSECAWLDLKQRQLIAPPEDLLALMLSLSKTDDYIDLPSYVR